jgi:hypothetical protein
MRPQAALAELASVPEATALPDGAIVLAVDESERRSLKLGAALWLGGALLVGFAIGRWTAARKERPRGRHQ